MYSMIIAAINDIKPNSWKSSSDFLCTIRFGNLLTDSGDILLCPVSENFVPSNPLAQRILRKDSYLKKIFSKMHETGWYGSEHAAFLPCKKLKYRGVLFVAVDFYSEDRAKINSKRIAEALEVASKFGCTRLSSPEDFSYSGSHYGRGYGYLFYDLQNVLIEIQAENTEINFNVEFVIQRTFDNFKILRWTPEYYDFTRAFMEKLPYCAEVLPWYRKRLKKIRHANALSKCTAGIVKKILTDETLSEKKMTSFLKHLCNLLGEYDDYDPCGACNEGYVFFLLKLCEEMPWGFKRLEKHFESYKPDSFEYSFKERFEEVKKKLLVRLFYSVQHGIIDQNAIIKP